MEAELNQIIAIILVVVLTPIAAVLSAKLKSLLNVTISGKEEEILVGAVRRVVLAVEQMGLSGTEAKDEAIALAQEFLGSRNMKVDVYLISTLIEAIVMEEFNREKL